MKRVVFISILLVSALTASAQLSQHGILLNGGIGSVHGGYGRYADPRSFYGEHEDYIVDADFEYKSGVSAGYRLRFKMPAPKSFHYDLDLNIGAKFLNYKHDYYKVVTAGDYFTEEFAYSLSSVNPYYFTSLGGTVNYSFVKNFSAGLGIEPSFYLNRASKNKYDVPIVAKVAYQFRFVEVGITGKFGLTNVLESSYMTRGKYREIQMSLFIPLKTK